MKTCFTLLIAVMSRQPDLLCHLEEKNKKQAKNSKYKTVITTQVSHGMLATRYHLPPPQVATTGKNNEPKLADAEEVFFSTR